MKKKKMTVKKLFIEKNTIVNASVLDKIKDIKEDYVLLLQDGCKVNEKVLESILDEFVNVEKNMDVVIPLVKNNHKAKDITSIINTFLNSVFFNPLFNNEYGELSTCFFGLKNSITLFGSLIKTDILKNIKQKKNIKNLFTEYLFNTIINKKYKTKLLPSVLAEIDYEFPDIQSKVLEGEVKSIMK